MRINTLYLNTPEYVENMKQYIRENGYQYMTRVGEAKLQFIFDDYMLSSNQEFKAWWPLFCMTMSMLLDDNEKLVEENKKLNETLINSVKLSKRKFKEPGLS